MRMKFILHKISFHVSILSRRKTLYKGWLKMSETARRTKCTTIVPWNEVRQLREQVCRSNTTKFQPNLIDSASSIARLRKSDTSTPCKYTNVLNKIRECEFLKTFDKWIERWDRCIENGGRYFEKESLD